MTHVPFLAQYGKPPVPYIRRPNPKFDEWVDKLALTICVEVEETRPEHTSSYPCLSCSQAARKVAYDHAEHEL